MKKTCNKCKAVLDGIMIFHPDTCLSCVIDIHMKEYQNRIKKQICKCVIPYVCVVIQKYSLASLLRSTRKYNQKR